MRQRLLLTFLSLTAFVLIVLIIPLGVVHQQTERDNLTRRIERDAVATGAIAADVLRTSTPQSRSRLAGFLADYTTRTGARVVIIDRSGASLIDTGSDQLGRAFGDRPEFTTALAGRIASGERTSTSLGYRLMYVAVPVSSDGEVRGAVRISYPARELQHRVRTYWLILGGASIVILLIVAALGAVIAGWVTRPIRRLADTASAVGDGELDVRANEHQGPPEVRELARRFNESVAALETLILEQRDFVADASHQLRTPLQALHLRLDNAQISLERADDPVARAHAKSDLEAAYRDVTRLSALVESLLVLERADRARGGTIEAIPVHSLMTDRTPDWQSVAARTDARLVVESPDPELVVHASRVNIEQVLDNLLENACSASPHSGTVTVRASATATGTRFDILDEGPGMTEEQITQAFRRFHSTAPAPRAGEVGGFGLGLSIAQRLVERDGGTLTLHRRDTTGLIARVEIPRNAQLSAAPA